MFRSEMRSWPSCGTCDLIKNPTPSIDAYLLEEQFCQISSRSSLERQSLRLFEDSCHKKKNKMSSDVGSVPDPKMRI